MNTYRSFFGLTREPFTQDIGIDNLYMLPGLAALTDRVRYAVETGGVNVISGEVGSGKSTSLRYATAKLHPSAYRIIALIAHPGTIRELYRQICLCLDHECPAHSITILLATVRGALREIAAQKQTPVLLVDEAHLLRHEVFAQMHTIGQFDFDSKPLLPIILAGQNSLLDNLHFHSARPLASRVLGRSHLEGLKLADMQSYLKHHLEIAGVHDQLFSEQAIVAIHQGSGGLLRRANLLARGSLMAAAVEKCTMVAAEHVRIASTEII
jgi:type II secretory pathway predicted ATPase ExeA